MDATTSSPYYTKEDTAIPNIETGAASPAYSAAFAKYYEPPASSSHYDPENPTQQFDFSVASIRRGFIRKVYAILMLQLAITCGFIALLCYEKHSKEFAQNNLIVLWIALGGTLVLVIVLACFTEIRRRAPTNYILLFLFTIFESYCIGVTCSFIDTNLVLVAMGITGIICISLSIFAFQTKWDFTGLGPYLFVFLVILIVFGILTWFFISNILQLVYSALGAMLFSVYLVYDTQLMIGGKHKHSISPEEYVFAALNIYLDILNIFLYILRILSILNR